VHPAIRRCAVGHNDAHKAAAPSARGAAHNLLQHDRGTAWYHATAKQYQYTHTTPHLKAPQPHGAKGQPCAFPLLFPPASGPPGSGAQPRRVRSQAGGDGGGPIRVFEARCMSHSCLGPSMATSVCVLCGIWMRWGLSLHECFAALLDVNPREPKGRRCTCADGVWCKRRRGGCCSGGL
jgi:hypothetical protein